MHSSCPATVSLFHNSTRPRNSLPTHPQHHTRDVAYRTATAQRTKPPAPMGESHHPVPSLRPMTQCHHD